MPNMFELYEIDRRIYELIDPETGELLDEDAFSALQMEREAKIENTALWYKNTLAEYEAVKKEADSLKKRSDALRSRAARLKDMVDLMLDGETRKTPKFQVSFHASSAVECADEAALIRWAEETGHKECLSYKPPSLLKTAIGNLIKSGISVPGAEVVRRRSIQIK